MKIPRALFLLALALPVAATLAATFAAPLALAAECVIVEDAYVCARNPTPQGAPTAVQAGARREWTARTPGWGSQVAPSATPVLVAAHVSVAATPPRGGEGGVTAWPIVHLGGFRAGDPARVTLLDSDGDGVPEDASTTPGAGPLYWPRLPALPLPSLDGYVPSMGMPRIIFPSLP